jgi:hypothetical protein
MHSLGSYAPGPRLQRATQVGDPLLDLLQPGRGLRLQALTFSTALLPGTLSDLLQPRALLLELRDDFPDLSSPAKHTLIIDEGRVHPRMGEPDGLQTSTRPAESKPNHRAKNRG